MSSVCSLGTIRNTIRGVNQPPPHTLFSEMIDDAEHSSSKKIFIDINTHDKKVVIGYENAATHQQLINMVTWNSSSAIHDTTNISTCGLGLKYFEFRVRGNQTHISKINDNGKEVYMDSKINSNVIYNSAMSEKISEAEFSEILKQNTSYVCKNEETIVSLDRMFTNEDGIYPFNPKTIVNTTKIENVELLEWFNDDENVKNFEKELINKYYEEIKCDKIIIYIKFPKKSEFIELGKDCKTDIIGSTKPQNKHNIGLHYVDKGFDNFKEGEYILEIDKTFIQIQKNGNSFSRKIVSLSDENKKNILLQFNFIQYTVEDNDLKNVIVGTSLEDYCGVYLKIGNKFIDGKPMSSTLVKRNLQGARMYRGILDLQNPERTKKMLGIHGLKSEFNLNGMLTLEPIIKQCCIIYKNYCSKYEGVPISPESYCIVQTSNQKTKRKSKPGHVYLRVVGVNFYKIGMTGNSNRSKRIFDSLSTTDYDVLKKDFPEENIFPQKKFYYEYLSSEFNEASSTEQRVIEEIMKYDDIVIYNNKKGDGIREYFHCDNADIIKEIKQIMIDALNKIES